MCEPVTLAAATLAISAGSAAAAAKSQADASKAQGKYQNKVYSETANAALEAQSRNYVQTAKRLNQETAAASDQAASVALAAGQARGAARVSASERGVTGGSVEDLIRDFDSIESSNTFNIETNLGWLRDQMKENLDGSTADNQGRIRSVAPRPLQGPNYLALGLKLADSGLQAYDRYKTETKP